MSHSVAEEPQQFGGSWTREKLRILEAYLDAYTTALKKTRFSLWYVDAFAGSGAIKALDYDDERAFLAGSTQIALSISDSMFDHLLFVEKDATKAMVLREQVVSLGAEERVRVEAGDANRVLPTFCDSMETLDRAVVFLDPFGTEVSWGTVEAIASTKKCDVWILFPVSAIRRLLPRKGPTTHGAVLSRVFGDESWRELQQPAVQQSFSFFDDGPEMETEPGVEGIAKAYLARLETVFAGVAQNPRILKNSRNSPLYLFMFAVGSPSGKDVALRIARHILTKI